MGYIDRLFKVIHFIKLKTQERVQYMQQWVNGTRLQNTYPQQWVKINATHIMDATVHVQVSALCVITIVITRFATCKQALGLLFHWMPDQPTGS